MMAAASKDIGGKVLGIFFPIMAFVASGYEHCVANMYFIPAGIFACGFDAARTASGLDPAALSNLNWASMWTNNIISVTLGNLLGVRFLPAQFTGGFMSEAPAGKPGRLWPARRGFLPKKLCARQPRSKTGRGDR